jgi:hypothetical protein
MATPVVNRQRGGPREEGLLLPVQPTQNYSLMNRTVFYVPRFTRHLRRRLRSHMRLSEAWQSTRTRMLDYR